MRSASVRIVVLVLIATVCIAAPGSARWWVAGSSPAPAGDATGVDYVAYGASSNQDDVLIVTVGCIPLPGQPPMPCVIPTPHNVAYAETWQEANGCEGLQRGAMDCDGDGLEEPADELVDRVRVDVL